MNRLSALAVAVAFLAAGCGSSTSPSSSPTKPTFSATLLPSSEVPPVAGPEASGSGSVTITFDVTKDAGGNVTAASVTFVANVSGFPPGTTVVAGHIHKGDPTCACPVAISANVSSTVLPSGSGSLVLANSAPDPAVVQDILNNPGNYYFNLHSMLHPGGFARGQLSRVQ